MRFTSPRERRLWTLATLLLLAIYSTLYVVRPVTAWLRERNLLTWSVGLVVFALAAWVLRDLRGTRPGWREWLLLGMIVAAYAALWQVLTGPEEAMHFVEYGLVGALVYLALRERRRVLRAARAPVSLAVRHPAVTAVLITAASGWIDEGIQHLLPNRYYGLRDVGFNAAAGLLGVLALGGREWAREADRRPGDQGAAGEG